MKRQQTIARLLYLVQSSNPAHLAEYHATKETYIMITIWFFYTIVCFYLHITSTKESRKQITNGLKLSRTIRLGRAFVMQFHIDKSRSPIVIRFINKRLVISWMLWSMIIKELRNKWKKFKLVLHSSLFPFLLPFLSAVSEGGEASKRKLLRKRAFDRYVVTSIEVLANSYGRIVYTWTG